MDVKGFNNKNEGDASASPDINEQRTRKFNAVEKNKPKKEPLIRQRTQSSNHQTEYPVQPHVPQHILRPGDDYSDVLPESAEKKAIPAPDNSLRRTSSAARRPLVHAVTAEKKKQKKKKRYTSLLVTVILLLVIILTSAIIAITTLSCANDLLGMNRSKDKVTISISNTMNTDDIIDLLASNGLIKNRAFCKLMSSTLLRYKDTTYIMGVYELSPSMALEGMLNRMSSTSISSETVTLTFPEGYTVDQIIAKLDENEVCSAASLRQTMDTFDFSADYPFLADLPDVQTRYHKLEGYMFPDTYDFYIGENPASVIQKFLTNFYSKWTDEYQQKATELGMSVDDVVRLASIIEKEAFGETQMLQVSSVLHNRMADTSGSFRYLQCDSTGDFINKISDELLNESQRNALLPLYDTYQRTGYPIGAICNPGVDAIHAALFPSESEYMYFRHDKKSNIYLAVTEDEHNQNAEEVRRVNEAED